MTHWNDEELEKVQTMHATALMLEGEQVVLRWMWWEVLDLDTDPITTREDPQERIGRLAVDVDYSMRRLLDEHDREDWIALSIDGKTEHYLDPTTEIEMVK